MPSLAEHSRLQYLAKLCSSINEWREPWRFPTTGRRHSQNLNVTSVFPIFEEGVQRLTFADPVTHSSFSSAAKKFTYPTFRDTCKLHIPSQARKAVEGVRRSTIVETTRTLALDVDRNCLQNLHVKPLRSKSATARKDFMSHLA